MFGRLATLAHGPRALVETPLYGLQYVLMLPAGDPSLFAGSASAFDRATLTGVGPVTALFGRTSVPPKKVPHAKRLKPAARSGS